VSTAGGFQPHWRGDGRELFYLGADQQVMAVDVKASGGFSTGEPKPLFQTHIRVSAIGSGARYDVTRDGQRFLLQASGITQAPSPSITVVTNWTAALEK
jgi:hypothetical protein